MEIIVPCAGLSTRFPGLRPKYLLVDYSGKLMIENSIKNFIGKNKITISILKQHDIAFKAKEKLVKVFEDKVNIVTIENETNGPADTVYQTILKSNFNTNSELLIKDCDSFYDFDYEERLNEIHIELEGLNEEAASLAKLISVNYIGLNT